MITRGSAEGGLIVMVGSAVNVICQHRAEMSSRKEANAYLEKQVPTKQEQYCFVLFPRLSNLREDGNDLQQWRPGTDKPVYKSLM